MMLLIQIYMTDICWMYIYDYSINFNFAQLQGYMYDQQEPQDLPDLFHKASIRQNIDPNLPIVSQQIFVIKKWVDQNGNRRLNQFIQEEELGRGAFGTVIKVTLQQQSFAMKIYNKIGLRKQKFFAPDGDFADALQMLDKQINIIKRLNHKNIAKCYYILDDHDKLFMVLQLCDLGQIMRWNNVEDKYVRNQKVYHYVCKKYSVNTIIDVVRIIFIQVCQAVKYLHDNNITNRDIKVDNILCKQTQQIGKQIKIVDFTTSRYDAQDDKSFFPSGTPGFRGPQHQFATSQGYSCKASDIWSIGICMYLYYHEIFPFYGESELEVDIKAKNQQLKFDKDCAEWFVNIVNLMTKKQWKDRIGINEAIKLLTQSK